MKLTKAQNDFIYVVRVHAQKSMEETGVPASVTIAQAILESYWGRSKLAVEAKNLFGIKAKEWNGPVYRVVTTEYVKGQRIYEEAVFRKYASWPESIMDHGRFLLRPVYDRAKPFMNDPVKYAEMIAKCGYATDPFYALKLKRMMDEYKLYKYDS